MIVTEEASSFQRTKSFSLLISDEILIMKTDKKKTGKYEISQGSDKKNFEYLRNEKKITQISSAGFGIFLL